MSLLLAAALLVAVMATGAWAAKLPTLKMLSTRSCPACVQMNKVLKRIDRDYSGRLATQHVYLEEHEDVAEKYNVRYVPTLIFIDAKGHEFAQKVGYLSLEEVLAVFKKHGIKI